MYCCAEKDKILFEWLEIQNESDKFIVFVVAIKELWVSCWDATISSL
jgi:hypothetical protein